MKTLSLGLILLSFSAFGQYQQRELKQEKQIELQELQQTQKASQQQYYQNIGERSYKVIIVDQDGNERKFDCSTGYSTCSDSQVIHIDIENPLRLNDRQVRELNGATIYIDRSRTGY